MSLSLIRCSRSTGRLKTEETMSRTVYVNGEYLAEEDAKISVFDRGFLFADGVYEVSSVIDGKLIDNKAHLARLQRSLEELSMPSPNTLEEIEAIQKEMVRRNSLEEGLLYLQVSRGAADRDFNFPAGNKILAGDVYPGEEDH